MHELTTVEETDWECRNPTYSLSEDIKSNKLEIYMFNQSREYSTENYFVYKNIYKLHE